MSAIWQPRLPRWAICSTSKLPDKDERHLTGAFFMLSLCAVNARSQHFADHIMQDPPVFKVRQFIAGINSAARMDDLGMPIGKSDVHRHNLARFQRPHAADANGFVT